MLKQLIQRLLDSRTTPSEAAHSAMPSSSYVTVTATAVQAWGEMAKGVATFDGFVRVSARATSSNANVRVTNDTATMFSQAEATASGQTQGVFVPVAKGDSWSVFATNRDNPVVRVVKAIGGGYQALKNALLQGGVLCRLSRLYSSLRRSSLSIRKDKSLLSLHQFSINTRSTRQVTTAPTNGATLSQLPSTDGSELKEIVQALCTLMSALIQTLCDKASTDRADLYRVFAEYLRAAKSITCSRLAGRYLCGAFFLSRVTAPQLNVANGGASC